MIGSMTLALALLLAGPAANEGQGRPFLHPLLTDHAVLQRDRPIPIWGWTEPGQRVKVVLAGQSVETTADDQGRWSARLGPYPAGGPHTLTVTGPKSVEVTDLLVGDVWLCSGQSNMEWPLDHADRAKQEVAAADHPRIRLFSVPHVTAQEPKATVDASWEVCTPASAASFSAVGYFFGREIQREVGVPIGLIDSSWGGTVAEAWTSVRTIEALGDFDKALAAVRAEKDDGARPPVKFTEAMTAWWNRNDPGSTEQPRWSDPKFDASGWKTIEVPGNWEDKGYPDFDGIAWFRKEVDLPEAWDGKALKLELGPVDDRDTTYVNGTEVGRTNAWNTSRNYTVPAGVIRAGRNVIAVRVLDTSGLGGFGGSKESVRIRLADDEQAEPIALAGAWSFLPARPINELSTPPEPAGSNPNRVTVLYNGMLAPLKPFPIKGAIWYQGESNASRAEQYRRLLPAMIRDWRTELDSGEFPFFIVQVANYMARKPQPGESAWAELREAQVLTARNLAKVEVALAIDIGDAKDIHPTNKQEVGRRLALDALATTYGKDVEYSGPTYKAMETKAGAIRLTFDHLGGGLAIGKGTKLEGFAVAGPDGKYTWADATIEGDTVVIRSPEVADPRAVRYAWADNPACNLYNQAGLPAVPFRTDGPAK